MQPLDGILKPPGRVLPLRYRRVVVRPSQGDGGGAARGYLEIGTVVGMVDANEIALRKRKGGSSRSRSMFDPTERTALRHVEDAGHWHRNDKGRRRCCCDPRSTVISILYYVKRWHNLERRAPYCNQRERRARRRDAVGIPSHPSSSPRGVVVTAV